MEKGGEGRGRRKSRVGDEDVNRGVRREERKDSGEGLLIVHCLQRGQ